MDGGAWWATVHGVVESDMTWWLSVPPLKAVLEGRYDKNVGGNDDDDFTQLLIPVELNGISYDFYFM